MNLFPQQALNAGVRKREVFGWAMYDFANSGYTTVVVGPLTYGLITLMTGGNHRVAILSTSLFFVGGLWLLRPIDMGRGQQSAHDTS